jgi:predicted ribosome-associated RNA-binding protein Tma20
MKEIIEKINKMSREQIEDQVSELELTLEDEEIIEMNKKALEFLNRKEICSMLRIPHSDADKHYTKLQPLAYYDLTEENKF